MHPRERTWGDGSLTKTEFRAWVLDRENRALLRRLVVKFRNEGDGGEREKRFLWKYGLATSPSRMAHFIAQGREECGGLTVMMEVSKEKGSRSPETQGYYQDPKNRYGMFYYYERAGNDLGNVEQSVFKNSRGEILPLVLDKAHNIVSPHERDIDPNQSRVGDGMKFRGRGMHQLTGRNHYAEYWVYRGWLDQKSFTAFWWAKGNRNPARIDNPEKVSMDKFSAIDTSGEYWTRCNVNNCITPCEFIYEDITKVTKRVNGGTRNLNKRKLFSEKMEEAITDIPIVVDHTKKPRKPLPGVMDER